MISFDGLLLYQTNESKQQQHQDSLTVLLSHLSINQFSNKRTLVDDRWISRTINHRHYYRRQNTMNASIF